MPGNGVVVTFGVFGNKDLRTGRFYKGLLADNAQRVYFFDELANVYRDKIRETWASKHGRTGETEQSIDKETTFAASRIEKDVGTITIAGNVGFVLHDLPTHVIPGSKYHPLAGPPNTPGVGRTTNMFGLFGPKVEVTWFQGKQGGDSFSPDPQWYEDAQPYLDAEGIVFMGNFGTFAANQWASGVTLDRFGGTLTEIP